MVIVASILAWIAGVSVALVYFFGLSEMTGWWIAGLLGITSVVAASVILYEMSHAVEIDSAAGDSKLEDLGSSVPWNLPGVSSKRYFNV